MIKRSSIAYLFSVSIMRKLPVVLIMLLTALNFSCKKLDSASPQPAVNYDVQYKIFRVIGAYNGAPYTVKITQIRPNSANNPFNVVTATQDEDFDYAFTPAVGDSIKVTATSESGTFTLYAYYLNVDLGTISLQPTQTGGSTAEFDYVVH
jgi:hypothetical protein